MTFEEISQILDKRIEELEKTGYERFRSLEPLMKEDITLIKKCYSAGLKFPRYEETVTYSNNTYHPEKFVASRKLGKMGIKKDCERPTNTLMTFYGNDTIAVVVYREGNTVLHFENGYDNFTVVSPSDANVYGAFCDEFEIMHAEFREWLEEQLNK